MTTFSNRFGVTVAAVTIVLLAGAGGVAAQDQTAMFADADGMTPPDAGAAYAIPVNDVAVTPQYPVWPELAALLADPDGMNSPSTGFAYDLPIVQEQLSAEIAAGRRTAATQ